MHLASGGIHVYIILVPAANQCVAAELCIENTSVVDPDKTMMEAASSVVVKEAFSAVVKQAFILVSPDGLSQSGGYWNQTVQQLGQHVK